MLRFDVPQVHANAIRADAFIVTLLCAAALFGPWPALMVIPALQGLVRGFFGHHRCPSSGLTKALMLKLNLAGPLQNAGAKMFAAKLLFIASSVSLLLWALGLPMWRIPVGVLLVFSTLEWAFGLCVACWVYGAWYQRFPPAGTA